MNTPPEVGEGREVGKEGLREGGFEGLCFGERGIGCAWRRGR